MSMIVFFFRNLYEVVEVVEKRELVFMNLAAFLALCQRRRFHINMKAPFIPSGFRMFLLWYSHSRRSDAYSHFADVYISHRQ